jgi:hypothetical protein
MQERWGVRDDAIHAEGDEFLQPGLVIHGPDDDCIEVSVVALGYGLRHFVAEFPPGPHAVSHTDMPHAELTCDLAHAGEFKISVESEGRWQGHTLGFYQQRGDDFAVRTEDVEAQLLPKARVHGESAQQLQQGESRIGLRRGELEIEEDMPHTALVLEPGNEFLEHRR